MQDKKEEWIQGIEELKQQNTELQRKIDEIEDGV